MNNINRIHAYDFEHYCVQEHQEKYKHKTYHWNNISEDDLFNCGFITNFNEFRLRRKRDNLLKKINSIQEYFTDFVGLLPLEVSWQSQH